VESLDYSNRENDTRIEYRMIASIIVLQFIGSSAIPMIRMGRFFAEPIKVCLKKAAETLPMTAKGV